MKRRGWTYSYNMGWNYPMCRDLYCGNKWVVCGLCSLLPPTLGFLISNSFPPKLQLLRLQILCTITAVLAVFQWAVTCLVHEFLLWVSPFICSWVWQRYCLKRSPFLEQAGACLYSSFLAYFLCQLQLTCCMCSWWVITFPGAWYCQWETNNMWDHSLVRYKHGFKKRPIGNIKIEFNGFQTKGIETQNCLGFF